MSKKKGLLVLLLSAWVGFCLVWFFTIYKKEENKKSSTDSELFVKTASGENNTGMSSTDTVSLFEKVVHSAIEDSNLSKLQLSDDSKVPKSEDKVQRVEVESTKESIKDEKSNTNNSKKGKEETVAPSTSSAYDDRTIHVIGTYYFTPNSGSGIRTLSPKIIKKLQHILLEEDASLVIITGHTDKRGSKNFNYKLGLERAEKIKALLTKRGIAPEKIQVNSKGEDAPITSNKTMRGRSKNRRVEIAISQTQS